MLSSLRSRLLPLRAFWVVMLVLCAVVKPVVVVACETHEAQHAIEAGHGHDDAAHRGAVPVDEAPPSADARIFHALMHQGHCCVHGAALVEVDVSMPVVPSRAVLVVGEAGVCRCVVPEPMLRPPIPV